MMDYIAINGQILPKHEAKVSVEDRGFRLGDGVFETLRVVKNVPYQWDFHIKRLAQALESIKISFDVRRLSAIVKLLMQKNRLENGFVRIQITRGVGSIGYLPVGGEACYYIETQPALPLQLEVARLFPSRYRRPAKAHLPMGAKLTHGLPSTLALLEAAEHGCDNALMLSADGYVSEAANANLFWLKKEVLYTPSLETACVDGGMRHALLRLSPYPVKQVRARLSQLQQADALFITNVRSVLQAAMIQQQETPHNAAAERVVKSLREALLDDMVSHSLAHQDAWARGAL